MAENEAEKDAIRAHNFKALLIDGKIVPTTDLYTWGQSFDPDKRWQLREYVGEVLISTVFLGLDHSLGDGPPLWFETMVFPNPEGDRGRGSYMDRYATQAEAEAGHKKVVEEVKAGLHTRLEQDELPDN